MKNSFKKHDHKLFNRDEFEINLKEQIRLFTSFIAAIFFVFGNTNSFAQNPPTICNIPISCLHAQVPSTEWKCIDGLGGGNISARGLIMDGTLLSQSAAQTTPQYLIIRNGLLLIDVNYTFAPGSEIVFATGNAGMNVVVNFLNNVPATLVLDNVSLHGCQEIWNSIKVVDRCTLDIQRCTIQDAFTAITLAHGSYINCYDNKFDRNVRCIYAGSAVNSGNITLIGNGISGNDFNGANPLIQFVLDGAATIDYPNVGLIAQNVINLQIGSSVKANTFHDFTHGQFSFNYPPGTMVSLTNTNCTINNTTFINYIDFLISSGGGLSNNFGVVSKSDYGPIYSLNIQGNWPNESGYTFLNIANPVAIEGVNTTISNANFSRAYTHINFNTDLEENNPYVLEFNITGNRFESYIDACIRSTSLLKFPKIYNNCNISENYFYDNMASTPSVGVGIGAKQSAIKLRGSIDQEKQSIVIYGNYFYEESSQEFSPDNNTLATLGTNGVTLLDMSNASILSNYFEQQFQGPVPDYVIPLDDYSGIVMSGGSRNDITANTFTGIPNNQFAGTKEGINIKDSRSNTIRCNNLSNLKSGSTFVNQCNRTIFARNSLTNHTTAFKLENANTIIGQQVNQRNSWPSQSTTEANFFGITTNDPNILNSQFQIYYSESQEPDLWANPRTPSTSWFVQAARESYPLDCPSASRPLLDEGFSKIEQTYLDGNLLELNRYPALEFDVRFDLYDHLKQNNDLVLNNSVANTFFIENNNSTLGQLHDALIKYSRLNDYSTNLETQIKAKRSSISALRITLENIQSQLMVAQSIQQSTQLTVQYKTNAELLQSVVDEAINLNALFKTERQNKFNDLLDKIANIQTTTICEDNLKIVLLALTHQLESGNSTTAITDIRNVASQCRYSGGYGVALARTAIGDPSFNDNDLCVNQERNLVKQEQNWAQVVPNPATSILNVSWNNTLGPVIINVYDLSGSVKISRNYDQATSNSNIDIHDLTSGIYILEIRNMNEIATRIKFIKSNF